MTTRQINEDIGINGAYLKTSTSGLKCRRITRAKKVKGVLMFRTLLDGWIVAPVEWALVSGSTGRAVAHHSWR